LFPGSAFASPAAGCSIPREPNASRSEAARSHFCFPVQLSLHRRRAAPSRASQMRAAARQPEAIFVFRFSFRFTGGGLLHPESIDRTALAKPITLRHFPAPRQTY
jgi:hypothetical protein